VCRVQIAPHFSGLLSFESESRARKLIASVSRYNSSTVACNLSVSVILFVANWPKFLRVHTSCILSPRCIECLIIVSIAPRPYFVINCVNCIVCNIIRMLYTYTLSISSVYWSISVFCFHQLREVCCLFSSVPALRESQYRFSIDPWFLVGNITRIESLDPSRLLPPEKQIAREKSRVSRVKCRFNGLREIIP